MRSWRLPPGSTTHLSVLALTSVTVAFLAGCGPIAQQEANNRALRLVTDTAQPVAPVDRESFAAGSSREATENANTTERGGQVLKGETLRNDTVKRTVAKRGLPDAVEATADSYILFYRCPPHTIIIDNSGPYTDCQVRIPTCEWKTHGSVVGDLPLVPTYARVFGFNEVVTGSWPVTLSTTDVAHFSVPLIPQPPPGEVTDGSDYTPVAQKILSNITVVNHGPDDDRAQRAFARLAEVASVRGINWKLYVYEETYNAGYGVPDGSIFITRRLVECLDDDQLTAVLAHLMAHERYGHSRTSMKRVNQLTASLLAGSVVLLIPTLGQSLFLVVPAVVFQVSSYRQMLSYLDRKELEADALATQYLAQLHIPPETIVNAMYKASRRPLSRDESSWGDVNLWFGNLHRVEQNGPDFGKLLDAGQLRLYTPQRRSAEKD